MPKVKMIKNQIELISAKDLFGIESIILLLVAVHQVVLLLHGLHLKAMRKYLFWKQAILIATPYSTCRQAFSR